MKVTHTQAIEKINSALEGGVEQEWKADVAAVLKYLGETDGEITHLSTAFDFAFLVERHTGVRINDELAYAAIDIITA